MGMIRECIIKYDDDEKKKDIHGGYPLIGPRIELIRCKDCKYFAYFKEGDFYPGVTRHNGEKMPVRSPKTEGFCNHILMYKNGCSRIHTTKACTHFRRHGT